jgi:chemosensory pili system protein ChpA (sensor histidine kinase/response regulator)
MIDKELEIRLQFLEEATEYLNTIESGILGLATTQVDNQRMDAVLRAAHSIKGGAAMMGFQTLSQIAHRLEDFFKVLKNNKPAVDGELESLLLTAVSHLRQVITLHHGGTVVDNQWLDTHVNPVFEQLSQRLGDSTSMDTTPELPEEGQNMVSLIFESEVEAYLQQLEVILADPEKPQLLAELTNMAQDLGGLGEMLQIPNFSSLCASVIQHLETSPERVEEIARLALQEWRRSQAALLIGQADTLVAQINLDTGTEVPTIQTTAKENLLDQILTADIEIPNPQEFNDLLIAETKSNIHSDLKTVQLSLQSDSTPSPNLNKDTQENTVRVSVKLLDQLNDLFGELTIERNGLNLYLERLRNLVKTLSRRVRSLRSLDTRLETNHEKVATKQSVVSLIPSLEQEAAAPKIVHSDNDNFDLEINRNRNSHPLSNEVIEDIVRIQEVTDDIALNLEDTDQTVT